MKNKDTVLFLCFADSWKTTLGGWPEFLAITTCDKIPLW